MLKRIFLVAVVLMILVGIGGYIAFRTVSKTGASSIENWISLQLQTLVNSYLNPHLSFDGLDYQYPGTVTLKNLRIVADDPAGKQEVAIIGCTSATITLGEIPRVGKPIVIQNIVLDEPLISLISNPGDQSGFVGFSNLVKNTNPTTGPAGKLTDHFKIRLIEIINGKIKYDPRLAGAEPMVLDQINTKLNVEPADQGWFKLSTNIKRDPIFQLGVAGQLNLDTLTARDLAIKLNAKVSPDNLSYLPPQIQALLKAHEIAGELTAQIISTDFPLQAPQKGQADLGVKILSANCAFGKYRIPIQSLNLQAHMNDSTLSIPVMQIDALRGTGQMTATAKLVDDFDTQLQARVQGMMLEDLITTANGEQVQSAGSINAMMKIDAPLKVVMAKMEPASNPIAAAMQLPPQWGTVNLQMTDGRLGDLPVLKQISSAIAQATNLVRATIALPPKPSEKATFSADLKGDQAVFNEINYVGEVVAVRGKGNVSLDQQLDLQVNGGPVERVQQMLGKQVANTIGIVTDKILTYQVNGTIQQPQVKPVVGGGAINKIGEGIGNIGESIGNIIKPKDGD